MAAIPFQEAIATYALHHLSRIAIRKRGDAKRDVPQNLDVNTAQAENHQGTEQRIFGYPDHEFHAGRDHRLHDDAVQRPKPALASEARLDAGIRFANRAFILQVQLNATDVGLVDYLTRRQFYCDRKSNFTG